MTKNGAARSPQMGVSVWLPEKQRDKLEHLGWEKSTLLHCPSLEVSPGWSSCTHFIPVCGEAPVREESSHVVFHTCRGKYN